MNGKNPQSAIRARPILSDNPQLKGYFYETEANKARIVNELKQERTSARKQRNRALINQIEIALEAGMLALADELLQELSSHIDR